ncbi:hypothetical protein [Vagococcus lutrae]|uniref:hypothetical protein n=1 Tax=Vagococcus lutrae TaxID=81947 RepID=UPI00288D20C2|nr:hypothetical protein [Vagococcus lutrae]MDT2841870.1 hypothetical protein [Vagococcus lutrae]
MRPATKAKLQEILFDYPYYDAQIERLEDCKKRDVMIERKEAITRLLNKSGNDSLRDAIKLYYFSKPRRYTWQGVAFECGMHPSQLSRAHTEFLYKLAKELGEM